MHETIQRAQIRTYTPTPYIKLRLTLYKVQSPGTLFFNLFVGMECSVAFTLFAETDAVTQVFVLFQMNKNVICL